MYYMKLGAHLESLGHEVAYFAMQHSQNQRTPWERFFVSGRDFSSVHRNPIDAFSLFIRMLWSLEAQKKLEELLTVFKPDIAHVHNIYHHLSPSILPVLHKHGIPVVMTAHDFKLVGPHYELPPHEHLVDRYFYTIRHRSMKDSTLASIAIVLETMFHRMLRVYPKHIRKVFTASHFLAKILRKHSGFHPSQIVELPLGVERQGFLEFPVRSGFIYAGRLVEGKGLEWLIQTWREQRFPHTLTIVGSGPIETELHRLAEGLPIVFTGFLSHDETLKLMARSRCLIAPSTIPETFGLSAMEALSVGTPVIAAASGALSENVQHGSNGYLVDPEQPSSLGQKILGFLSDPQKEYDMREQACISAKRFTWEQHLSQLLQEYASLLTPRL